MKGILLILAMITTFQLHVTAQSIESFDWLVGTWENTDTKPGETAREVWSRGSTGELHGVGVTLRGTYTVFVEHLKILRKDNDFYYSAEVSHNPAPVLFKIIEFGPTSFISENPEHDFPKSIAYSLDGDALQATISGGNKQIPFHFRRTK